MTDPTREQVDESSVHSDKSLLELSREDLIQRVYDLERLHRAVRMYGVGYVLKHGTGRIQLNPLDVTIVLKADQPETEAEVRSRLAEMETVLAESDIDVSYRQRLLDEAKQQVQVLQDRIAKVREIRDEIECSNCEHPAKLHKGGRCLRTLFTFGNERECGCDWGGGDIVAQLDAVLDGEGEATPFGDHAKLPKGGKPTGRKVKLQIPESSIGLVANPQRGVWDSAEDAVYDKENRS